jgi:carboxypeptidase C (cathepsin A)
MSIIYIWHSKMIKAIWPLIVETLAILSTPSFASQIPLTDATSDGLSGNPSIRTLTHESHPDHSLTIKAHGPRNPSIKSDAPSLSDICPGATSGYTGYLNHGDKHFYFAYFESRSKPEEDPLVLWLNGGPGCSSMTGLFMELGPCTINEDGESARENPYSWISAANVFFLDQPVSFPMLSFDFEIDLYKKIGVGFSYHTNESFHGGEGGTFAASEDIYAFMRLWYKAFPDSRSLPFSIAGESYGG